MSQNTNFFNEIKDLESQYPQLSVIELNGSNSTPIDTQKQIPEESKQIIGVAEHCDTIPMLTSLMSGQCGAVVHKENPDYVRDFKRTAKLVENRDDYFLKPDKLFFEGVPRFKRVPFSSTADKGTVLCEVDIYCQLLNSNFLTESLQAIFEELFMNAMFDAPREAKASDFARTAELMFGDDGHSLVISCLDQYGSLKPEKLLNRILKIEEFGASQMMNMDSSLGGAGIGSSILYACSSNLIVGVVPGKHTRVSCMIPLKTNRRKFAALKKNIQVIVG